MSDVADDRDRQLWAAVLHQAIQDAVAPVSAGNLNKYRDQREALDWLNPDNPDFIEVCFLAGLDPEAVFEGFRRNACEIELVVLTPENAALEDRRIRRESAENERQASREARAIERAQRKAEEQDRIDRLAAAREQRIAEAVNRELLQIERQSIRDQEAIERASKPTKAPKAPKPAKKPKAPKAPKAKPVKTPKPARTVALHAAFGEERTLKEWASIAGLNIRALRARIARGKTLEDAITAPSDQGHPGIRRHDRFTLDGQTRTLAEWADLAGMPAKTLARRIKDGWPLDTALLGGSYTKAAHPGKTYTAFGQTHTAYQWAKLLGMSEGAVAGRLRKGWPIELALTTPTQQRTTRTDTEQEPAFA